MKHTTPIQIACSSPVHLMRVLIVDDDAVLARAITRMLANLVVVVVETDPRVAVARIFRGEHFELVLCDLRMKRLSGHDVLAAIRMYYADRAGMPRLVVMSGDEERLEGEVLAGAIGLVKPFRAAALRSLMHGA